MVLTKFNFDNITYRPARHSKNCRAITSLIGFDTEAYQDGRPFMFCTSLGGTFTPLEIPRCLFTRQYRGKHFGVWNLSYDSGALIYHLPDDNKVELWKLGKTTFEGYTYSYIPRKLLKISDGRYSAKFWDIFPFYNMSLNRASDKYLGERKQDMDVNLFTKDYVKRCWDQISRYCVQDASLTASLGKYLIDYLGKWNIHVSSLYSIASISLKYFEQNSNIVTVNRFWDDHKELLRFACEAYRGGKFEVTSRGSTYGYEYDINSAYPHEIASLVDITRAKVLHTREYQKQACYGFLKVHIEDMPVVHHPVSIKDGYVNIYPVGAFSATITKAEYDYLISLRARIKIVDAYWLQVINKHYPYREAVNRLYKIKSEVKFKDPMMYNLAKVMLNGFYGKMVQLIPQNNGDIKAGTAWNPIYGSYITANVRIRMSKIQNLYRDNCLAVHTDSVIVTRPMTSGVQGSRMGQWDFTCEGKTLIISNGIYQVGDKVRFRGFPVKDGLTLKEILAKSGRSGRINIPVFNIESWISAVHRGKFDNINRPYSLDRIFNLNSDIKRVWLEKTNADMLLSGLQRSLPRVIMEFAPHGVKDNMTEIKEGYFVYETDDFIKYCPDCGGNMYEDASLARYFDLTDAQKSALIAGEWGVAVCAKCGYVDTWER